MAKKHQTPALLIVEHPWWQLSEKPCQESVLPYLQGLAKRVDCETYYASFFDLASLRTSLAHLAKAGVNHTGGETYLYIAGHGSGRRLGGGEGRSINIASLIRELKELAGLLQKSGAPLTGVVIGSCELGKNDIDWSVALQGTSLRWVVGYRYTVDWFSSTQIDLAILHAALQKGGILTKDGKSQMLSDFRQALSLFSPDYRIHHRINEHGNTVSSATLQETLMIVGQAAGSGQRPVVWGGETLWPPNDAPGQEPPYVGASINRTDTERTGMKDEALIDVLRKAQHVVVFTGAGVSAESGVPTFRNRQTGLWARFSADELSTPAGFQRNPQLVWDSYTELRALIAETQPNPAHIAIARLQALVPKLTLITQNIDGLHQRAGSTSVLELHGNLARNKCFKCGVQAKMLLDEQRPPRCIHCGGLLRPDVVWFGEQLPADILAAAQQAVDECDILISVGTSGKIYPAADLPLAAAARGAAVIQVDPAATPLDKITPFCLRGRAGEWLPRLVRALESARHQ